MTTKLLFISTDGDSKVFHPVTGEELKSLCDGEFVVEYDSRDSDKILGYLLSNSFKFNEWVWECFNFELEKEGYQLRDGHYDCGNYSLFITDKVINKL